MPREIINESGVGDTQAVLAWGWTPRQSSLVATLDVDGVTVGLSYGDLDRLNRAVRRALKNYRRQLDR